MSVLRIENIDSSTARRYNSATVEEKHAARQVLSYWLNGDATGLQRLLQQRRQEKEEMLHREAMAYADSHPLFPLNWSRNKLTREEMNER